MSDKQVEIRPNYVTVPRRGLIVWVYSLRQLKNLRRFGIIAHVSRKMKYVMIYMDEQDVERNQQALEKLHFVRSVELSYRPDIAMDFDKRVGTAEALLADDDGFEVEELSTKIVLAGDL